MTALDPPPGETAMALMTGPQRAAAMLMLLGDEHGKAIWSELNEDEVRRVSVAMAEIGSVPPEALLDVVDSFLQSVDAGAVTGGAEKVEGLLGKVFSPERVLAIMSEVRGAAGRQVWRRLAHIGADPLAGFLRSEHPQTVAVVLSRLGRDQAGRVLAVLPDALGAEVVDRMLRLGEVSPAAIDNIEDMLHREFLTGVRKGPPPDIYEAMADRFGAFDRTTEARFLAAIEQVDADAARRIREKLLTFDDLAKLDAAGAQTLLRNVDKSVLARALKSAPDAVRSFFQSNMSTRAAKNLADDMEALGPLRLSEVEEAQSKIVQLAKSLSDKGEIRINKNRGDEELVG